MRKKGREKLSPIFGEPVRNSRKSRRELEKRIKGREAL